MVRIKTVPHVRTEDEKIAGMDIQTVFWGGEVFSSSVWNIYQLVAIKFTSFRNIEIKLVGMPHEWRVYLVIGFNDEASNRIDSYSPKSVILTAYEIFETIAIRIYHSSIGKCNKNPW